MLAKLACTINKPNAQTVLPEQGVPTFFERVGISDVRYLGGKMGKVIKETFGISKMSELRGLSKMDLTRALDQKSANYLYDLSRGIDTEPVKNRTLAQSLGCGKNFTGNTFLV